MSSQNPQRTPVSRRSLLSGAAALALGAPLPPSAAAAVTQRADPRKPSDWVPVTLADPALLAAFMKVRGATDSRLTIGWVDAVTYAFINGEAFPLYRLWAATWQVYQKVSDASYSSTTLEIAHFVDMKTGALLQQLAMPPSGAVVDVPPYRAGPSVGVVALHRDDRREFNMKRESPDGASFFVTGTALSSQHISQVEHDGNRFRLREDVGTRVLNSDAKQPGFFYREWSQWSAPWRDVFDPAVACARCELGYSAATAWRPWMKMGNTPGNTMQNGRGGKVEKAEDLPAEILRLTKQIHPDLLADPWKAMKIDKKTG
jgi:hypothetical protein